jgi:aconitate hydratase
MSNPNSFGSRATLRVDGSPYTIFRLDALRGISGSTVDRLPMSLKVLLENLLRCEDGEVVLASDAESLSRWDPSRPIEKEIALHTSRVLLQDFTGVPAIVDLAAMRDAVTSLGGDAARINPLQPVDLVIDHSVQVDEYGSAAALMINTKHEFERNRERYEFLRWGQAAFDNFRVVPPGTGICHQVNLEYLAKVVWTADRDGELYAYPDSLVGTDSHTTMINGLGVLGWGVGGIEAEAALLGQPVSMLVPDVVGCRLTGRLRPGATATDLVLTVTEMLRSKVVVGKFIEFYGNGLSSLAVADRATIANMSPEYGATMGFFPVDEATLTYLRLTGRDTHQVRLVESYCREQGLFRTDESPDPVFSDTIELDLDSVEPSIAGPKRPQDRVPLRESVKSFRGSLDAELRRFTSSAEVRKPNAAAPVGASEPGSDAAAMVAEGGAQVQVANAPPRPRVSWNNHEFHLTHGHVVIAAITSCTNTSNPSVMLAAGMLARNAVNRGLTTRPWVKTSLAPGSKVVREYFEKAGVMESLSALGFDIVGYGCTTCIGNSGPLPLPIAEAIEKEKLVVVSVLSGNRNFEGRINPLTRFNYLASPPLVVAYALAGRMDVDFEREPVGVGHDGPVFLRDIWPAPADVQEEILRSVKSEMFTRQYGCVFEGDGMWQGIEVHKGKLYSWNAASTYVKSPPFFDQMSRDVPPVQDIAGARVLGMYGDSITTDHISPAGSIAAASPAGTWLLGQGVQQSDFNSYGSRRGNHEVMLRGSFANIRLRNELAGGREGWWTATASGAEPVPIYDAAMEYKREGTPLLVIAGKEYGTGSSRDWAAKGTILLGVRAVIAESFERIHRSNLIGMGVLPLEFMPGQSRSSNGLTGFETYDIVRLSEVLRPRAHIGVKATAPEGTARTFQVIARIDTPEELRYYRNGGILQYVLRRIVSS